MLTAQDQAGDTENLLSKAEEKAVVKSNAGEEAPARTQAFWLLVWMAKYVLFLSHVVAVNVRFF